MLAGFLKPARDEYLSDWVDWLWSENQEIVFTATGGMMRVAVIEPPDLETAGREELVAFHAQLTETLALPGTGWSAWLDQWRREDRGYLPECDFGGNHAAKLVDDARRAQFQDSPRAVFTNRAYVALHWTPQQRDAVLAFLHDRDAASKAELLRTFLDQSDEVFRGLAHICPSVRVLQAEALGTYLAETVSYQRIPTALPEAFLAPQLAAADWETGTELVIDGMHVAAVEVHVFGAITPLTLEPLHELPFECRWTVTSHFLDPEDQRRALAQLRNYWRPKQYGFGGWLAVILTKNRSNSTSRADVDQVMVEFDDLEASLQNERDGLAIATMTVRVWDRNPNLAEDRAQTVAGLLNAAGMRARVATFNSVLGALADVPGNASKDLVNRRRPRIRLSTIGRCSPMTGLTSGARDDEHLEGPALLVAQSRRRGPLFWSLHAPGSDVGHTAVIGPTGGGKSALLSFAAMQYLRYPGSTVTMFDVRRSAMVATLCAGGDWLELGSGGIGVQPLRDLDTPEGMASATGWLQEALRLRNVQMTSKVDIALSEALRSLRSIRNDRGESDLDARTLTNFCAHVGDNKDVRDALRHYTAASGPFGNLMDGAVPGYGQARMLCIETSGIMHLPEAPLVLSACFRQIERERLIGGHPKLVMLDEAWQALQHPLFKAWIENLSRTGRKMNVQAVLCTQSVRDLEGEQTAVILEQVKQTIFVPNAKATDGANLQRYRAVGLSDEQIQLIAMMRPKGEYLLQTRLFTRVADITLDGAALKICGASREPDIQKARRLLSDGARPGAEFVERWLS